MISRHLTRDTDELVNDVYRQMKAVVGRHVRRKVKDFVYDVFEAFFPLPYHNKYHTYEVFDFTAQLLRRRTFSTMSNDDKMVLMVSALCHDYGHKGIANRNQSSMSVRSSSFSDLAGIDTSRSHNELFSIGSSINIIKKYHKHLFRRMTLEEVFDKFTDLIMSTDLALHDKYVEMIQEKKDTIVTMILILKLADLSHFLQDFTTHLFWVYKIHRESQGEVLVDVHYMTRDTLWFGRRFVAPLVELMGKKDLKLRFQENVAKWGAYQS